MQEPQTSLIAGHIPDLGTHLEGKFLDVLQSGYVFSQVWVPYGAGIFKVWANEGQIQLEQGGWLVVLPIQQP